MPRLFTAIEIPGQVAFSLAMMRGGLPGARWIDQENYHVTLRFIGDTDHRTADEIVNALARTSRRQFSLRLNGLNAFGGNKPHSIHACVEPSSALVELQSEQERIMQRIGLKAESRKFTPHVTLARLRGTKGNAKGSDVANWLALRGSFSTTPFSVDRFVLLSSRDSVGGGPYVTEEVFDLGLRNNETPSVRARLNPPVFVP
ncbi:MAG: RNA 2',3'-cyclic phosphodiesterase [Nitratireductor sp.]